MAIPSNDQRADGTAGKVREAQATQSEHLEQTALQPRHPNSSLVWFWAAIVAFSIGLILLGRAYL